jgi:hypothetical protein
MAGDEGQSDVPAAILERAREICLALPDAYEEQAWTGVRWLVRKKTFAHVLLIDAGWPPVYAREAGTDGPACVLMFRSSGDDLEALRRAGPPYFAPVWRADEVGLLLGTDPSAVDWTEVGELVSVSFQLRGGRASG